ncbi:MAG: polymerase sigma-70 factor, subfamily [Microbacteriaceae bacterium]|nr:polymerase sigma-70 factor, subfamily [Microbacteriaceae bacterium]
MAASAEVAAAVATAHRREWAFVLASTVRVATDLGAAEEAVQDAYASALATWDDRGIPDNTGAWLTTAARRRALDLRRRAAVADRALPRLLPSGQDDEDVPGVFPDDRLRLVFTCCSPALPEEARVALTMRLVCGLSTAEVARAFLVSEPTMAARITRAKKRIAAAGVPYQVPEPHELPERLESVLSVVHLVFTTGHTAPVGADLMGRGLAERALELALLLRHLLPDEPEVAGLLALILLTDARRHARVGEDGVPVLLADQDRERWDADDIRAGLRALQQAFDLGRPGRFTLMAAIAAVHDEAAAWAATDWVQIRGLYDVLLDVWSSPIVALNRAIAVGFADGPESGLAELDRLASEPLLAGYGYFAAARADFLARLHRADEARDAYEEALLLTGNAAERRLLERKLAALPAT